VLHGASLIERDPREVLKALEMVETVMTAFFWHDLDVATISKLYGMLAVWAVHGASFR
jgi:hypothetical protein